MSCRTRSARSRASSIRPPKWCARLRASGIDQCADHRARRSRAEDRRRGGTDPEHCRTNQPARTQRHHRGRARRRSRARLVGRRLGGKVARGADRQGDGGYSAQILSVQGIDRLGGRRDPPYHRTHARDDRAASAVSVSVDQQKAATSEIANSVSSAAEEPAESSACSIRWPAPRSRHASRPRPCSRRPARSIWRSDRREEVETFLETAAA